MTWVTTHLILFLIIKQILKISLFTSHNGNLYYIFASQISTPSVQFSSVTQLCPTLCNCMYCSMPNFPVHHQFPELTQTHVHWVSDAIQPSHPLSYPSPPAFNLSQHQGSHQMVKVSVLPMNIQDWFPLGWTGWISLQSKGLSKSLFQHHSSEASILWCSAFVIVQLSHPYMTTGKTIALTRQTFGDKVMSLLFNMLSRFVITFRPRSKHLLISRLQSPSAGILEPPKIKSATVSPVSTSICHEVMGPDAMILVFWMVTFKVLVTAIKQERELKFIQSEKEQVKLSLFADYTILHRENPTKSTKCS